MGYELNTKAYSLFIQIEVGLREYFIELIKNYNVQKWTQNFLGNSQRDTLNEVTKRINEAYKSEQYPVLEDIYIFKLYRAKRDEELSFIKSTYCNPFYYLNWTDLEALMRIKLNVGIIEDSIGKVNRETIVEILKLLSFFRNDIAHSRFISENDFKIIKAGYDQISVLIPNFTTYVVNQSKEDNIAELINQIRKVVNQIETVKMLSLIELDQIFETLKTCKNSFWLNSIGIGIIQSIDKLFSELIYYKDFRKRSGGLLQIMKWKEEHANLIKEINSLI
jgi:hypothetical protein